MKLTYRMEFLKGLLFTFFSTAVAAYPVSLYAKSPDEFENKIEKADFYPIYDGKCEWSHYHNDTLQSFVARNQRTNKSVYIDFDCIDNFFSAPAANEIANGDVIRNFYHTVTTSINSPIVDVCRSQFEWLDWAAEAYKAGALQTNEGQIDISSIQFAAAVMSEECGGQVRALNLFGRAVELGWPEADARIRAIDHRTAGEFLPAPPMPSES